MRLFCFCLIMATVYLLGCAETYDHLPTEVEIVFTDGRVDTVPSVVRVTFGTLGIINVELKTVGFHVLEPGTDWYIVRYECPAIVSYRGLQRPVQYWEAFGFVE